MNTATTAALLSIIDASIDAHNADNCPTCQLDPEDCPTAMALYGKRADAHDRATVTTTQDLHTPTSGIIREGTEVTITERVAGYYILAEGTRRTGLLSAAQVTARIAL